MSSGQIITRLRTYREIVMFDDNRKPVKKQACGVVASTAGQYNGQHTKAQPIADVDVGRVSLVGEGFTKEQSGGLQEASMAWAEGHDRQ